MMDILRRRWVNNVKDGILVTVNAGHSTLTLIQWCERWHSSDSKWWTFYADADSIKRIYPEDKNTTVLRNVGKYQTTQHHIRERVIHQRAKCLRVSYRNGTASLSTWCWCWEQLSVVANNVGNKRHCVGSVVSAAVDGNARTLIASCDIKSLFCQDSFLGLTLLKKYTTAKIKV